MNNYELNKFGRVINLKYITILVYIILLGIGGFIYVSAYSARTSTPKMVVGASSYAPLDIVSGDITSDTTDQIISSLESVTPEVISWNDINIAPDSYKKDYSSNSAGNISFKIVIPRLETAYDVGVYNQENSSPQISVSCSLDQPAGYKCNYPIVGGE